MYDEGLPIKRNILSERFTAAARERLQRAHLQEKAGKTMGEVAERLRSFIETVNFNLPASSQKEFFVVCRDVDNDAVEITVSEAKVNIVEGSEIKSDINKLLSLKAGPELIVDGRTKNIKEQKVPPDDPDEFIKKLGELLKDFEERAYRTISERIDNKTLLAVEKSINEESPSKGWKSGPLI
jgi:hypothetical protein